MYAVACIVVYEQARPGSLRGAFLDWARLLATQLSFSSGEFELSARHNPEEIYKMDVS
jgi:hypothetical protein